jgi:hypothetical protein
METYYLFGDTICALMRDRGINVVLRAINNGIEYKLFKFDYGITSRSELLNAFATWGDHLIITKEQYQAIQEGYNPFQFRHPKDYYKWLMKHKAASYDHPVTNSANQELEFYKHPIQEIHPIVAVVHDIQHAFDTSSFDVVDFYEGSDFLPVFFKDRILFEFEL